ncbi:Tim44/TimA family putative adaptor protein [Aestuariivirga sp.]|uniref:Tim44/TimA family putative adaptor protein n=1 Tax=Aestuariivirga sp. TaxID=2650926 RepID=UPI0025C33ACC|nr:Tim44/TimA family putative adaptor protein [Aestuariivirga sp.]MCA3554320.1 Tim44 domain-containing protein [Aestuariivirga sp.]
MSFDPINILLLAVALVVFWRLRSVLGTRTGTEKPPFDLFGSKRGAQDTSGAVTRLPEPTPVPANDTGDRDPPPPVWKGFADEGSPLAAALGRMAENDSGFTPRAFVDGAKVAYEMIIDAFARGDKAALKNLLSKEVFDGFARAIDARVGQGQRVDSRFVGIDKAVIQQASLAGRKASITMEFVSELISATYDKAGEVIEGDPKEIRIVTDVWTFERDLGSRDPNWKLVATEAPA